jgi:hypothetical protein
MVRIFLVLTLFFLGGCFEEVPAQNTAAIKKEHHREALKIVTQDGRALLFQVEIADTPQKLQQGLMFRQEMALDHGMIFLFSDIQPRSFWMKNTYLPLDVIFIGAENKIVHIGEGKPLSEAGIPSYAPAKAAIELNQGTATRMGIRIGDIVHFPRLAD